jgi:hypothetical protein
MTAFPDDIDPCLLAEASDWPMDGCMSVPPRVYGVA